MVASHPLQVLLLFLVATIRTLLHLYYLDFDAHRRSFLPCLGIRIWSRRPVAVSLAFFQPFRFAFPANPVGHPGGRHIDGFDLATPGASHDHYYVTSQTSTVNPSLGASRLKQCANTIQRSSSQRARFAASSTDFTRLLRSTR
mgnify:CR=1 FL=1